MSEVGLRTLVLNSNYQPISLFPLHTIPAEDAVTRIVAGTCNVVMEHERWIQHPTFRMKWPSVIVRHGSDLAKEGVKLDEESLYYRDHGKCQYCSKKIALGDLTKDHVHPKSKGGRFEWTNIVSACPRCNTLKGDALPGTKGKTNEGQEIIWIPKQTPRKPTYWELLERRKMFPINIDDSSWIPFLGDWKGQINIRRVHGK